MTAVSSVPIPPEHGIRVEPCDKRIRATLAGKTVLETTRALYVWEQSHYPQFYVPPDDIVRGVLEPSDTTSKHDELGVAHHSSIVIGDRRIPDAAWSYTESPAAQIRDHVRFDFGALDTWFEEDVEIFVHPRSPYTRIDALRSRRHVTVELDGVVVADSIAPVLLFETGLPVRYYLPKSDVQMDLFSPTETLTHCPYKGEAHHWSATVKGAVHDDVAWSYKLPTAESAPIAGLVGFYPERCTITVDPS